jgi:hypothetical protein
MLSLIIRSITKKQGNNPTQVYPVGHFIRIATLRNFFYLETALHVSGGTSTHHQKGKQLYLQHLVFITPLLLQ